MKPMLVSLALLVFVAAYLWPGNVIKPPPGVLVPDEPEQTLIADGTPWQTNGFHITPMADYHIRARVLATERYWLRRAADLSPLDLTVGWRRMSDQQVLDRISITRERRAFCYRAKEPGWPIPQNEINSHSANMHMIPASAE